MAGSDSDNCPYYGLNANAEFAAISGCSVVPTELDGGSGTRCSHWDDACLKDELMTGYISGDAQPLSRITIAGMEDLGHTVDYTKADPFGPEDLGSCPSCRRELSVLDRPHGEAVQLGLRHPNTKARQLSEGVREEAIAYGHTLLQQNAQSNGSRSLEACGSNGLTYVGDKVVSIVVHEAGELYSVIVKNE